MAGILRVALLLHDYHRTPPMAHQCDHLHAVAQRAGDGAQPLHSHQPTAAASERTHAHADCACDVYAHARRRLQWWSKRNTWKIFGVTLIGGIAGGAFSLLIEPVMVEIPGNNRTVYLLRFNNANMTVRGIVLCMRSTVHAALLQAVTYPAIFLLCSTANVACLVLYLAILRHLLRSRLQLASKSSAHNKNKNSKVRSTDVSLATSGFFVFVANNLYLLYMVHT